MNEGAKVIIVVFAFVATLFGVLTWIQINDHRQEVASAVKAGVCEENGGMVRAYAPRAEGSLYLCEDGSVRWK